mmetsp:Transcript_6390/g.5623  ORF Transcript_6390/g.5623 Transcript_6390/m.5623 type:complete len:100 (-) Transcript_6390:2352-2651(-)
MSLLDDSSLFNENIQLRERISLQTQELQRNSTTIADQTATIKTLNTENTRLTTENTRLTTENNQLQYFQRYLIQTIRGAFEVIQNLIPPLVEAPAPSNE